MNKTRLDMEEAHAEEALSAGIKAVLSAMSEETRFTNENEAAFALLRKGCRHSARAMALRQVMPEQQAVVVSFLARVADRRLLARRVKELGQILAKASPSWQQLLLEAEALGGASGLLSEELKALNVEMDSPVRGDDAVPTALPAVPAARERRDRIAQYSRVFLREKRTQRYLSIANPHSVVMTELPASLFVCHLVGKGAEFTSSHEAVEGVSKGPKDGPMEFGLEHEGIPSHSHFLGCRRFTLELSCSNLSLGKREIFRLGKDTSLQHQHTGMCLYVDPSCHKVSLSAESSSSWEVLAAI